MKKISLLLVLFIVILTGCSGKYFYRQALVKTNQTILALDTVISITIYGKNTEKNIAIIKEGEAYVKELEHIFSRTEEDSELNKLNRLPAGAYPVSEHLGRVIQRSLFFSEQSQGAFDSTIGALSTVWSFKESAHYKPSQEEINELLGYVNYKDISVNEGVLTKHNDNIVLDLGGIAKGYIGDELRLFFMEKGIRIGTISLGGDVITIGTKPDDSLWVIGIGKPFTSESELIGKLSIAQGAVVTSGTYQRFFEEEGQMYHHILNPETGYPTENNLLSVTVLADNAMDADALSTICFILGVEKGKAFLEETGLGQAVFYDKQGNFVTTEGLEGLTIVK